MHLCRAYGQGHAFAPASAQSRPEIDRCDDPIRQYGDSRSVTPILLHALGAVIAAAASPVGWAEIADAMEHAHTAAQTGTSGKTAFLSAAEAADIEAVATQIIPTEDTPRAREAGVIYFIDRALATFLSQLAADYRAQLVEFRASYRERYPGADSFASLTGSQQLEHLSKTGQTPFVATTHLLTMLGMFTLPSYGGNRDGVGWKVLGFQNAHVFYPPFGYSLDLRLDGESGVVAIVGRESECRGPQ
jgi:gluconate 2-dehydrogenase gamma chain